MNLELQAISNELVAQGFKPGLVYAVTRGQTHFFYGPESTDENWRIVTIQSGHDGFDSLEVVGYLHGHVVAFARLGQEVHDRTSLEPPFYPIFEALNMRVFEGQLCY